LSDAVLGVTAVTADVLPMIDALGLFY